MHDRLREPSATHACLPGRGRSPAGSWSRAESRVLIYSLPHGSGHRQCENAARARRSARLLHARAVLMENHGGSASASAVEEPTNMSRRPRFEMKAAAENVATRAGVGKLGLATTQGAVDGIKMYAATHAAKEGAHRQMIKCSCRTCASPVAMDFPAHTCLSFADVRRTARRKLSPRERACAGAAVQRARPRTQGVCRCDTRQGPVGRAAPRRGAQEKGRV